MRSVILVCLSDNVLTKEDWPVRRLVISKNGVESASTVHHGSYSMEEMPAPGWSLDQLLTWLQYESNPRNFPNNYHDVKTVNDERWCTVHDREGLERILARGVHSDETLVVAEP